MVRDIARITALGDSSNLVQLKTGTKESGQRLCRIFVVNEWSTWKKMFVRFFEVDLIFEIPLRLGVTGDAEDFSKLIMPIASSNFSLGIHQL